ncbi:MAG: CPBP family intramembrane metalloprotease [Candidatus Bathyarchaeota archaeon]|nr:CPBP family intramembrane metalloprotease [Candidatus Bathyarchaeota archaeon]
MLESQRPKTVSPGEAGLVIVVTFFIFVYLSMMVQFAFGDATALIVGELLILAVPLIYLLTKRVNIRNYVKIDENPKHIVIGLACAALLLLVNIAVSNTLLLIFGESTAVEQSNALLTGLSGTPSGLAAVAASLALAGICEEFAFRGFLQNSIFKSFSKSKPPKFSFAVAVIISSLVFGLFHFDPQLVYTIAAFTTGLALGYMYYRWNYTVSATAHAGMNLIVLVLLLAGI